MITEQPKYDSMLQEMAIPFNQFHGITISMYDAVMEMKTYENDIRSTGNAKYNSQWRQMEIQAWYNEFIMNNYCNASMLKIMKQPHNSNGKPRPMKYMLDDRLIQPVSSIIW